MYPIRALSSTPLGPCQGPARACSAAAQARAPLAGAHHLVALGISAAAPGSSGRPLLARLDASHLGQLGAERASSFSVVFVGSLVLPSYLVHTDFLCTAAPQPQPFHGTLPPASIDSASAAVNRANCRCPHSLRQFYIIALPCTSSSLPLPSLALPQDPESLLVSPCLVACLLLDSAFVIPFSPLRCILYYIACG